MSKVLTYKYTCCFIEIKGSGGTTYGRGAALKELKGIGAKVWVIMYFVYYVMAYCKKTLLESERNFLIQVFVDELHRRIQKCENQLSGGECRTVKILLIL